MCMGHVRAGCAYESIRRFTDGKLRSGGEKAVQNSVFSRSILGLRGRSIYNLFTFSGYRHGNSTVPFLYFYSARGPVQPSPWRCSPPPIERGSSDSSKRQQPLKIAAVGPTMTPCLRRHLRGVMWRWRQRRSAIPATVCHCRIIGSLPGSYWWSAPAE
jgi:hypothetical protein